MPDFYQLARLEWCVLTQCQVMILLDAGRQSVESYEPFPNLALAC